MAGWSRGYWLLVITITSHYWFAIIHFRRHWFHTIELTRLNTLRHYTHTSLNSAHTGYHWSYWLILATLVITGLRLRHTLPSAFWLRHTASSRCHCFTYWFSPRYSWAGLRWLLFNIAGHWIPLRLLNTLRLNNYHYVVHYCWRAFNIAGGLLHYVVSLIRPLIIGCHHYSYCHYCYATHWSFAVNIIHYCQAIITGYQYRLFSHYATLVTTERAIAIVTLVTIINITISLITNMPCFSLMALHRLLFAGYHYIVVHYTYHCFINYIVGVADSHTIVWSYGHYCHLRLLVVTPLVAAIAHYAAATLGY